MYTYPFVQTSDMIVFPLLTPSVFVRPKQDSSLSMAQNDQPARINGQYNTNKEFVDLSVIKHSRNSRSTDQRINGKIIEKHRVMPLPCEQCSKSRHEKPGWLRTGFPYWIIRIPNV